MQLTFIGVITASPEFKNINFYREIVYMPNAYKSGRTNFTPENQIFLESLKCDKISRFYSLNSSENRMNDSNRKLLYS